MPVYVYGNSRPFGEWNYQTGEFEALPYVELEMLGCYWTLEEVVAYLAKEPRGIPPDHQIVFDGDGTLYLGPMPY